MTSNAISPYWSHLAESLSPYVPGEQPKDKKYIKLNTNENPYPPSPKVLEAIRNAANESLKLYPEPSSKVMREVAAERWSIKPEQVFAGNGSDEILAFAFATFFNNRCKNIETAKNSHWIYGNAKADIVLFPDITYSFYPVYANLWNVPYKTPALAPDFSIDIMDYKHNSGGVVFPNPNAPTGRALSINALKQIAQFQEKQKKVFIVDEAYIAFADESGTGSMIPYINEYPNLLVVRTLSKESSLAGLRLGYAVGNEDLVKGLCRVRDSFNSYTVDRLAQAAAVAALSDMAYYDDINARIRRTRDRIQAELRAIGFNVIPSQANFIFASPPLAQKKTALHGNSNDKPTMPAEQLFLTLKEKGILVRYFKKPRIDNYLRISIGTDEDMDAFLRIIKEI